MPAGYSKRSLAEKLGVKPGFRVAFVRPPETYFADLGPLPDGASIQKRKVDLDFVHAFFKSSKQLDSEFPILKASLKLTGALWVSWPKKAAKVETDLNDNVVREIGLRHGLVDIKVCAVDEVWSGLKFVRRLKDRK